MDRYYINNPKEIFQKPLEYSLIYPYHDIYLRKHIQCAANEIPIILENETYYFGEYQFLKKICDEELIKDERKVPKDKTTENQDQITLFEEDITKTKRETNEKDKNIIKKEEINKEVKNIKIEGIKKEEINKEVKNIKIEGIKKEVKVEEKEIKNIKLESEEKMKSNIYGINANREDNKDMINEPIEDKEVVNISFFLLLLLLLLYIYLLLYIN